MTNEHPGRPQNLLLGGWHVFGVFGFALAQPLFDLLGRFPEFLVAHRVGGWRLILLATAISAGVPGLLLGLESLLSVVGKALARAVHLFVLWVLLGLFLWQVFNRFPAWFPPWAPLALAGTAAAAIVAGYAVQARIRLWFSWLAAGALLFPIVFLGFSPAARLLTAGPSAEAADSQPKARSSATVVMVVFDEFPTLSLLDENGGIDAIRYPNFARLAREAHWFANATTVSEGTLISIPAILDGLYPTPETPRLPIQADHPRNLFTMLRPTHRLRIVENLTQLAPEPDPAAAPPPPLSQLGWDLAVLSSHLALPADWTGWLPPVTESWRGFGEAAENPSLPSSPAKADPTPGWGDFDADWSRRDQKFRDFLQGIENTGSPTLHFFHSMLPHASWRHLPDGRRYALAEPPGVRGVLGRNDQGLDVNLWLDDPWLTLQGQQRHLLQVGFVDTLVGELVQRLRETGLYRDCLLVVTADHGSGFQAGDSRRGITPTNLPEILWVPLFIKLPGQTEGRRVDENVQTIDILPTIAEALSVERPWQWDGTSALSPATRPEKKIAFADHGTRFEFVRGPDFDRLLRKRLDELGWGDWDRVFRIGEPRELLGRSVADWTIADGPPDLLIQLDGEPFFERVEPESGFLPALIRGRVTGLERRGVSRRVALAVNGRIEALTRTSPELGDGSFGGLVPPSVFRRGHNQVEAFLVEGDGPSLRLIRGQDSIPHFRLETGRLVDARGRDIPIQTGQVLGWAVGGVLEGGAKAFVGGWAANARAPAPAETVAVLLDGQSLAVGRPSLPRPDAAARLGPKAVASGFMLEFPTAALQPGVETAKLRVFAISKGIAGELNYPAPNSGNWPFLHPHAPAPTALAVYSWGSPVKPGEPSEWIRLVAGWGTPEGDHIWTTDREARFTMLLPPSDSPLMLTLTAKALLAADNRPRSVVIRVQGREVGEWTFREDRFDDRSLEIPLDLVEAGGPTSFTLQFSEALSAEAAKSPDRRRLGMAITSLRLDPAR